MSLNAKCQATYADFRRNVAVMSKNRKTSAIYGSIIRLRPNPPEYLIPSSRRRKRSASKDGEEAGAIKDGEVGASSERASTPISITKVLKLSETHAAQCCRLGLPRPFCEMHNVEKHVTMTDSTGHKQWHMRFQSFCSSRRSNVYAISNGWREFSYDHSLKPNDSLVFTLLSTSHFVVQFATSDGSTRAMLPTRDGTDYPWKINYARLDCLSHANDVDTSKSTQQAVEKKLMRKKVAPIVIRNKQRPQKEMFCQCHTAKDGEGRNSTSDKRKEYVLPELTHLECKNPDGSSYLQIVDSDSEITCVDEG